MAGKIWALGGRKWVFVKSPGFSGIAYCLYGWKNTGFQVTEYLVFPGVQS